jgi:electron transport complex protein RnfE
MNEARPAFVPNPVFGSLLGLCPLIAAADSLADGFFLGLGVLISILLLAMIIPFMKNLIPGQFHPSLSLALSAVVVLLYTLAVEAYSPTIAAGLDFYLPLLTVNCLCLHTMKQSEGYGSIAGAPSGGMNRFGITIREAFGYFAAAILIGAIRETIGMGSLSLPVTGIAGYRLVFANTAPLRLLVSPAGGFMLIGGFAALYRLFQRGRGRRIP